MKPGIRPDYFAWRTAIFRGRIWALCWLFWTAFYLSPLLTGWLLKLVFDELEESGSVTRLLVMLGGMFLRGFREVIGMAVVIVGVFMALNAVILISGIVHLIGHPEIVRAWWGHVQSGNWYPPDAPIVATDTRPVASLAVPRIG